jgi:hypothetical protein
MQPADLRAAGNGLTPRLIGGGARVEPLGEKATRCAVPGRARIAIAAATAADRECIYVRAAPTGFSRTK